MRFLGMHDLSTSVSQGRLADFWAIETASLPKPYMMSKAKGNLQVKASPAVASISTMHHVLLSTVHHRYDGACGPTCGHISRLQLAISGQQYGAAL